MKEYFVKNKIEFSNISDTHFKGKIDNYMMRYFQHRVLSGFAKTTVYGEAEDAIIHPTDDATVVGRWSGEFWGKLTISACRVYEYTKDEGLKKFLGESAHRILAVAREDGYVNSYRDSANVIAPDPIEAEKVIGWSCDWNWNIWCRKYTLWGLTECAMLTNEKSILDGAYQLAIQLITELEEKEIRLGATGTTNFCGMPSGSIIKPMLILYRMTEDERIINFCIKAAEDWDREDGLRPNIIRNALEKKPVHEWYPDSHLWAKAYEMMSCLDGLLELYRVTGTEKYFEAVKNMYELLNEHEGNVVGSVGFNDIFANASRWMNVATEPCDVVHWMRVCSELYTLTGDTRYMDSVELAFYNAYFAGVSDDGEWSARCVRTSGRHMNATGQSGRDNNHCCADNLPRGYLNVTALAVMAGEGGYYINQFCPFESVQKNGDLVIRCREGYLETGRVTLEIQASDSETIYVRVPKWAGNHATVSGTTAKVGSYVTCHVETGTTEILIDFDYKPIVHDFEKAVGELKESDLQVSRWLGQRDEDVNIPLEAMMKEPCSYISFGPLLLARSKKLGATVEELFHFETIHGKGYQAELMPLNTENQELFCRFAVHLKNQEKTYQLEMCDYASAADVFRKNLDPMYFNLYL